MEEMSAKEKNIITCPGNEELQSVIESSAEKKHLFKMSLTYLLFFLILLNYQQTTSKYFVNDSVLTLQFVLIFKSYCY